MPSCAWRCTRREGFSRLFPGEGGCRPGPVPGPEGIPGVPGGAREPGVGAPMLRPSGCGARPPQVREPLSGAVGCSLHGSGCVDRIPSPWDRARRRGGGIRGRPAPGPQGRANRAGHAWRARRAPAPGRGARRRPTARTRSVGRGGWPRPGPGRGRGAPGSSPPGSGGKPPAAGPPGGRPRRSRRRRGPGRSRPGAPGRRKGRSGRLDPPGRRSMAQAGARLQPCCGGGAGPPSPWRRRGPRVLLPAHPLPR
jgi:hypothetical protein